MHIVIYADASDFVRPDICKRAQGDLVQVRMGSKVQNASLCKQIEDAGKTLRPAGCQNIKWRAAATHSVARSHLVS